MFVLYSIMQFIYQKCATHIIRLQSKHYIFSSFCGKCGNPPYCV